MIYEYEVATVMNKDNLAADFDQRLCWMRQKGYTVKIDVNNGTVYDFMYLRLQGEKGDNIFKEEDIIHIFQHQMAEILAEHIIKEWEEKLIWKKIVKLCRRYGAEEKKQIFEKAYNFLYHFNENESLNMLINFNRKNQISARILEYIKRSSRIIVDGFINFRMQDYLKDINYAVEIALEEFKNEKEFNEFVNFLRCFVNSQPPKVYEVNIMVNDNGEFIFWDKDKGRIGWNIGYYNDLFSDEINLDDILVSVLITLAPLKIVLHNLDKCRKNKEALEIIKRVFAERINICLGCEHCQPMTKGNDLQF
ncbi:putative sporulation protein YtxC [Thermosyntropha sp.]|uniref:putative sporulation protein YtxC n=1 Tax=Thermosyntropha sp. TaxID=2740820 RepID=UPI0025D9E8D6|nr:putative sporulation protein YtxC [Thermosyntropha sp.]MBO8158615.1 putative sporulation protein YtxC [Thermosyntropha sp.]